jgi:DNA-binding transcriptional ArsR family regulator
MVKSDMSLDRIFSSLADPTRRMILYQIALGKSLTASEIAKPHSMSFPAISRHLKLLEKARLITRTRHGSNHYFTLLSNSLIVAADYIASFQSYKDGKSSA